MLIVRSLVFNLYFYAVGLIVSILGLPVLLGPQSWSYQVSKVWGYLTLQGARWILNLTYQVEGKENLPKKPYILASKHQSTWETAAMCALFPESVYVLKRELKYLPFFNFHFSRQGVISIDRKLGRSAITPMIQQAQKHKEKGRCIIIYPEGTRSTIGKAGKYRSGVFILQEGLKIPVVPVALNSGAFWPRRRFLKKGGQVTVSILPALSPGMARQQFMETLEEQIETRCRQLEMKG